MSLDPTPFIIDGWLVSPSEHTISRDGETRRLEPKVMELLEYFAARQGEVVARDELEDKVWHGALVGYDALTATIGKLRKALEDNTKNPRIIVTVPKRGYQLVATLTAVDSSDNESSPVTHSSSVFIENAAQISSAQRQSPMQVRKLLWIPTGLAIMLTLLGVWILFSVIDTRGTAPSILVLPIEDMQKDKSYDVFLDGVTEDLVTDLSRFPDLMVLASNTSFQYKGRNITTHELQQELDLDYILKGSARRNNDGMRINLQLIDAKQGVNVWAQRYDRYTEEIFTLQDEIIRNVTSHLDIGHADKNISQKSKRATNNLQAYELFLEGQRLSRIQSKKSNQQARELYKQAINKDPEYGRAFGALAYTLALDYRHGWTDTPIENLDRALQLAKKGVELNPHIPQTYWSLGYVYLRRKENDKALNAAKQSVKVAPNYADGYGLLGLISNGLAKFDDALKYIRKGKQLNPYYSWDYLFNEGFALYMKGHYKEAIAILEEAEERNENALPMKLGLAASYIRNNQVDDAQWKVEQIKMLNPATTIQHLSNTFIMQTQPYKDRYLNDLRKAGLPE
jgi:TolB-like protein/DNA-binding winged helix-turn-helix (wHTH) protein/Flp pilus assembly protein TadD